MSGPVARSLVVDGDVYELEPGSDGSTPLLHVLRWHCGRLGVRPGCGHGTCGACTVLVGDRAVRSCMTPVADVTLPVTTAEAVAEPIRDAFLRLQAGQCAYCINGLLVTVEALRRSTDASDEALRAALSEHLCRCCAHVRILAAARAALGGGGGGTGSDA